MSEQDPKIIVDSDWKQAAQQEKEQLAREAQDEPGQQLPEPSFLEIVNVLAMQAMVGLGGMQMPDGRQIEPDLALAKHHIDLLEVLEEKTKGNLADDEAKAIQTLIHELRMGFVNRMSQISKNQPESGSS